MKNGNKVIVKKNQRTLSLKLIKFVSPVYDIYDIRVYRHFRPHLLSTSLFLESLTLPVLLKSWERNRGRKRIRINRRLKVRYLPR